jgi:shikimate kinase
VSGGDATDRHVVLVGMMGAGKSTVGAELARRLALPFVDVDSEIERRQGRSIAHIFRDDGEPAFRMIERTVLADVLGRPEPSVVAAGGGAVIDPANRALMRDRGVVIWLRAQPDELARRVEGDTARPLLMVDADGVTVGGDAAQAATLRAHRLSELATAREAAYHQVSHDVVNVDHLSVDEVADTLVRFLRTEVS